jgi:hypothetical protein
MTLIAAKADDAFTRPRAARLITGARAAPSAIIAA